MITHAKQHLLSNYSDLQLLSTIACTTSASQRAGIYNTLLLFLLFTHQLNPYTSILQTATLQGVHAQSETYLCSSKNLNSIFTWFQCMELIMSTDYVDIRTRNGMYHSPEYYRFDEYCNSFYKAKGDWHWQYQIKNIYHFQHKKHLDKVVFISLSPSAVFL